MIVVDALLSPSLLFFNYYLLFPIVMQVLLVLLVLLWHCKYLQK
jgi:hypothetical protein